MCRGDEEYIKKDSGLQMAYLEFHRIVIAAALATARIAGACMLCPALTESMIPGLCRRVVIFSLAFITFPMVYGGMPPGEPNLWVCALVGIKEVLIGCLIGFFSAVPFWIAENIGNFIDNQRGATMGEVYSPMSGTQDSSTGLFFTQIVATLFFVGGAVFLLLSALYSSFSLWPVFGEKLVTLTAETPKVILGSVDSIVRTTVIISSPVILIMFLATLGLGFVNRTAPQLNVFFLSMPVKSALGITFLIIYLPFIIDMLMYTDTEAILDPVRKLIE